MEHDFTPYGVIPKRSKNKFQALKEIYPYLDKKELVLIENLKPNSGYLEYYSPDEPGSKEHPRPKELPMGKVGIEIRSEETRPIDVLGDFVSHYSIYNDPMIIDNYKKFRRSLTDRQIEHLSNQYQDYAQGYYIDESGNKVDLGYTEKRGFPTWLEMSGLPGLYRGYLFKQYEDAEKYYTPEQINLFNEVKPYLGIND